MAEDASTNPDRVIEIISNLLNTQNNFRPHAERHNLVFSVELYMGNSPPDFGARDDSGRCYKVTRSGPSVDSKEITIIACMKLDADGRSVLVRKDQGWASLSEVVSDFPFKKRSISCLNCSFWLKDIVRKAIRCKAPLLNLAAGFPPVEGDVIGLGSLFWQQAYIWKTSGKPFPLLDLPAEVRTMIYDECATFVYSYHWWNGWNYHPSTEGFFGHFLDAECGPSGTETKVELSRKGRVINGAGPIMGLLRSNKQISREFKTRMLEVIEFRITSGCNTNTIRNNLTLCLSNTISRLSLALSLKEWFKYFRVTYHRGRGINSNTCLARLLRRMRLSHLTIFMKHKGVGDWDKRTISNTQIIHRMFHMVTTGLVLLHASICTQHIPNVEVKGCISSHTKSKFQQLLSDQRNRIMNSITEHDLIEPSPEFSCHGNTWYHKWLWTS